MIRPLYGAEKSSVTKFLQLFVNIEQTLERRQQWLQKQEVSGLKSNGITTAEAQYQLGYLAALRDVLDSMKQPGKPSAIGKI